MKRLKLELSRPHLFVVLRSFRAATEAHVSVCTSHQPISEQLPWYGWVLMAGSRQFLSHPTSSSNRASSLVRLDPRERRRVSEAWLHALPDWPTPNEQQMKTTRVSVFSSTHCLCATALAFCINNQKEENWKAKFSGCAPSEPTHASRGISTFENTGWNESKTRS